jgi:hypothetical protein
MIQYSRDANDGIERPRRTGYRAFAGYDELVWGRGDVPQSAGASPAFGRTALSPQHIPASGSENLRPGMFVACFLGSKQEQAVHDPSHPPS